MRWQYGVLAIAAVVPAACSGTVAPDPTAHVRGPAGPSSAIEPVSEDFIASAHGPFHGVPGAESVSSRLVGPHSFLQLDRIATARALTAEQAERLDLGNRKVKAPLRASVGHELILAHQPDTGDVQPGLPTHHGDAQGSSKAELVVNGQARELADPPAPDQTIVASVPKGATVTLRMTDGGRPQELDLRTGKRIRTASQLYYPVREATLKHFDEVTYALGSGARPDTVMVSQGTGDSWASLQPYANGKWARTGRAFLMARLPYTCSTMAGDTDREYALELNAVQSLTLASGAAGHGSVIDFTCRNAYAHVDSEEQYLDIAFDVPADMRSGTLTYLPVGTFTDHGRAVTANQVVRDGGHSRYAVRTQHDRFTLTPSS